MKKIIIIILSIIIWATIIFGLLYKPPRFLYVVDGDTVKIEYHGKTESVRMVWIDAPESTTMRYWHAESWGVEATKHLKDIMGRPGKITFDLKDYKDAYWRYLWTVYLEGENVNQAMVDDWYAKYF